MNIGKHLKVIHFILGAEIFGALGAIATFPSVNGWYAGLVKPSFNPPNWIFGPVWTILFALMGFAAFLVYEKGMKNKNVREALYVFAIQFVFNVVWSFLFFGAHQPLFALIDLIILWILILVTIVRFYKIRKLAGLILLPYLVWVSFAGILNYSIVVLNR